VTQVLGGIARIAVGRLSDRLRMRIVPLRWVALGLALTVGVTAALVDAPVWILLAALIVAGTFGLSWNGLSFTAAAESAGLARSGAALGFQQTLLGVVGAGFPPAFAAVVTASSWRTAFALCVLGPVLGLAALWRVREPTKSKTARRRGTSAMPPAAR
jgi:MFS family permease